tara:strand:+ start:564 stop:1727 length:1164 start_codon:yes stop_codon:yes gene_type:complete
MNKWIEIEEKHSSGTYGNWPIALSHGKGSFVWDTDNNKFLDLGSGLGVIGIGHANKDIAKAVTKQAKELTHAVNGYYASPVRAKFLEKISSITPTKLNRIFLTNSGAEAVESAIKVARSYTGRRKIISMIRGYHGRSFGALSATWKKEFKTPYSPLIPEFYHVPFGRIEALKDMINEEVSAVILEPIQGEGGIIVPPKGYLNDVRDLCNKYDVLLIADEIQTGIGRTGTWFGIDHDNVIPDIICSAKMLGGGFPLGAMIMKENIKFEKRTHGSTFGGNLIGCQAGLAVINYMERNNILEYVTETGKEIFSNLKSLTQNINKVKEVRGRGFMFGIELNESAIPYQKELFKNRILVLSAGKKIIRLLPPLNTPKKELNNAIDKIVEILK